MTAYNIIMVIAFIRIECIVLRLVTDNPAVIEFGINKLHLCPTTRRAHSRAV